MCSQASFNAFCAFGNAPNAISVDTTILDDFGIDIPLYERLHLLKQTPIPNEIECPYCDGYASISTVFDGEKTVIHAECPHCGSFSPEKWQTRRWIPVWEPLLDALQSGLNCSGQTAILIPGILWSIGRCAVSGQSREIFVARGINTWQNDSICKMLPENKTSLLFVIGDRPKKGKCNVIPDDRIFPIQSAIEFDNGRLRADITPVKQMCDLLNTLYEPETRGNGKYAKIGDICLKLKDELRFFMHGIYDAINSAERIGHEYQFHGISQKELAERLNTTPVMINRAIKKDVYLDSLFKAANERQAAYSYGERMENGLE